MDFERTGYSLPITNHTAKLRKKDKLVNGKWTYKSAIKRVECYKNETTAVSISNDTIAKINDIVYYIPCKVEEGDMVDGNIVIASSHYKSSSYEYYKVSI